MSLGGKGGITQGTDLGPYLEKKERRDVIGEKIGMSGRQYDRSKYIAEKSGGYCRNRTFEAQRRTA
jgi:hypothetical protein